MSKKKTLEDVLKKNWQAFNRTLKSLKEDQLEKLLRLEMDGANRMSYLERIHTRRNTLRDIREKKELGVLREAS
jgi:hypothetical protein